MRDWSECLLSAGKRLRTAQDALTVSSAGVAPPVAAERRGEAETAISYAIQDLMDVLAWVKSR